MPEAASNDEVTVLGESRGRSNGAANIAVINIQDSDESDSGALGPLKNGLLAPLDLKAKLKGIIFFILYLFFYMLLLVCFGKPNGEKRRERVKRRVLVQIGDKA